MPAKKTTPQFFIGTSGFSYSSWKNAFYPADVPSSKWFEYYCTRFNTVELNNTFYRFPRVATLQRFYERSPDDFIFSVKAHKIITHTRRMKNAREKVDEFLSVVHEGLREKAGPVLFQLPPSFKYTEENINLILESVPQNNLHIIEFRNETWWNRKVIKMLNDNNLTFCNASYPKLPEVFYKTTDQFYLRMHGVPELFKSSYSLPELKKAFKNIPEGVKNVFIYFNNTMFKAGYSNALTMLELAGLAHPQTPSH
jgi:uncharacterized protein YecE (DUF72 family)